jgi:ABC-type dipeptide/oligopeptide/nickel transport system ATPase component
MARANLLEAAHLTKRYQRIATRIAVMRAGKFLEVGPAEEILHKPSQAYTRELLAAVPALPA